MSETSSTSSTPSSSAAAAVLAKSAVAAACEEAALAAAVVTATGEIDLAQLDRLLASALPAEAVREAAAAFSSVAADHHHHHHPHANDCDDDTIIDTIATFDVLCGRGGETNHHAGNIQYRQLVKLCQPAYIAAKRREKPKIAQAIVKAVRSLGGRFLKKDNSSRPTTGSSSSSNTSIMNARKGSGGAGGVHHGPDVNNNNHLWKDVGDNKAREKTSQGTQCCYVTTTARCLVCV
jgi:hypothetical protein